MSEPENFVARWSRLKQEASSQENPAPENGITEPPCETDGSVPVFDPASLPPIESITQASDIRPFLQAGVPAELVRAALRTAWAADPAIRDFIGIAESQWDFNDPTAMPGFGPLGATESAESLFAQAVSRLSRAPHAMAEIADLAGRRTGELVPTPPDEPVGRVSRSAGMATENPTSIALACPAPQESRVNLVDQPAPLAEAERGGGHHRRHGSALPKPS